MDQSTWGEKRPVSEQVLVDPTSGVRYRPGGVFASNGKFIYPDSLDQVIAYNGSGQPITFTVVEDGITYVQTLTYTSGNLTGISKWMAQP